jgi:gluconate 2-dehydrogenase alpha chain
VPEALRTGNLTLRTHTRVLKVLTDSSGRACGVQYVDANGELREQRARAVILAGYTFENLRLMFLSGDTSRPDGLGNTTGQLGRHTALKLWADVYGYFPDTTFNAHTGPASQMWGLDDWQAATFDSPAEGFVGGATLNIENQHLPLQIARDPVPDDVPRWGAAYRAHLRRWNNVAAVRVQPDSLTYAQNFIDLDPVYRDRSGFGLPVVRITADIRDNERRLIRWMQERSAEILRAMGATNTWAGPDFKGVCSSHDLGGARMGTDPAASVVDADLEVHDTPGLFVYGGAVFPTCTGVNPQLTLWALTLRAAESLADRLRTP